VRERLQKVLSEYGAASRREAERMILAGRVRVNGAVATIGDSGDIAVDSITIDGAPLSPRGARVYIMLSKPRGYITTTRDERGRKTVLELVSDCRERVYPVGRLDMDSEGLLILTNDGELTNLLTHPSNEKEKTYIAEVTGDTVSALPRLSQPMDIDGVTVRGAVVSVERRDGNVTRLKLTIREGRNRQIRKMCAKCGLNVRRLTRVSFGGVALSGVEPGRWRYLTEAEIELLRSPGAR
jgi:23S rRNA pseudouridine2605 synthase